MEVHTKSPTETKKLGKEIGADLTTKPNNNSVAVVYALNGGLGSGKTTFAQGFAEGTGVKARVVSPTFILMRSYDTVGSFKKLYHLDLYRLEGNVENQLQELGFSEVWQDPKNIVLIEWADKAKGLLPPQTIFVDFETIDESERRITTREGK